MSSGGILTREVIRLTFGRAAQFSACGSELESNGRVRVVLLGFYPESVNCCMLSVGSRFSFERSHADGNLRAVAMLQKAQMMRENPRF